MNGPNEFSVLTLGLIRFLYNEVTSRALESDIDVTVEVVGITLSQYQRDRAEERSSRMVSKGASLTFKVSNSFQMQSWIAR